METRPVEKADAFRIAEIYAHYVTNTVVTFDLEAPSVSDWEHRLGAMEEAGYPVLVGCEGGQVIGYAYVSAWKPKPAYRHTAEVSIYLDPAFTGVGRGRALLQRLLDESRRAGIRQIIALIADAGLVASIALHKALGFRPIGRLNRVGFKHDRWIDVDVLQLDLHEFDRTDTAREASETR
jgi:L-amino acid N-acyltransferase YncA